MYVDTYIIYNIWQTFLMKWWICVDEIVSEVWYPIVVVAYEKPLPIGASTKIILATC